jgi:hypothetical protein
VDVPLSLFSGWNTELSPPDQPEGASPANNDVVFTPGAVATRPGLNRVFAVPVDSLGPFSYEKSFVLPTGDIKNLYLTMQDGKLWVEDVTNSPGTATLLYQSTATYASSCTAQYREYIALSDGVHGADIPLQYDGTNLYRASQDGPGAAPIVTSLALPPSQMVASGNTLTRNNNQVTGVTATPHGLQVGYQAQISNVPDSNATTVNQTNNSTVQANNNTYWGLNSGQYRSNFNPGTSPLSGFVASGFGFNIPSSATILGVIASFGINSQAATTGTVAQVALWYTGAQEGTAKTPGTAITTTITVNDYGSAADLWGAALTPSIVNDPSFGFAISVTADSVRDFLNFPFTLQVYYTLSGPGTVANITSIVIDNETFPGLALVTTDGPNGLVPNIYVSIVGVEPANVASISGATWSAGVTTLTTQTNHNLNPGSVIQVASVTTSTGSTTFSFNGTFTVEIVPAPNQVTYVQIPITATDPDLIMATADTGEITVSWPIPDNTPTPNYFNVESCPTPDTFYIAVDYSDGTWTSGTVGFIWEGIFYVTSVPSATVFTYYQPGPNGATTTVGTVTPYGQAAPGLHLCQQIFLLDDGSLTAPSPPVSFIANGGQYISVSNLAIGPSNVIARYLAFTGAQPNIPGILPPFFYIAVPAQLSGMTVSTSTVVNDNTTTSVVLDFSDNTLYAATGISIPGNNPSAQIVLDPCAGFFTYASRLLAWGGRNIIRNLLNAGFEGGYNENLSYPGFQYPCGWTITALTHNSGQLVSDHVGTAWQITLGSATAQYGQLTQSAYLDAYGAPIFIGNQLYSIRFWAHTNADPTILSPTVLFVISSVSTGFSSSVVVPIANSTTPQWYQANFSLELPTSIPSDMTFSFWGGGTASSDEGTITIDDIELIFSEAPFVDNQAWISYADNLLAFDQNTGIIGPEDDLSPIRNFGTIRNALYIVTGSGLHETSDNGQTEPDGWDVDPVADNCGAFSIASVGRNAQGIGSAGKDWMMWSGPDGAQIHTGQKPYKISQEIQEVWDAIPSASQYQCWVKNYESSKRCYFGIPSGNSMEVLVMDYRNIDGASIAENPPIHISFSGKMIVSDLTRKWTSWTIPAYSGELMYRPGSANPQIVFGCLTPSGAANSYILNANQYVDDDFGVIPASYTTYFFVSHEMEQALQVGSHRHLYTMSQAFISGTGQGWTLTPYAASLTNPFPTSAVYPLYANPGYDIDFGINVETTRCAFTIQAVPNGQNQSYFKLQKLVINMAKAPWASVRGSAGGSF